jgi:hypothetical protein
MDDRPDFVLIMTDQQRFDQVGYQSNGFYETPNIDRFAQRGVVFENAYSGSTTCAPVRMSLLTGLQNHRVPTQINRFALREGFGPLRASGSRYASVRHPVRVLPRLPSNSARGWARASAVSRAARRARSGS